MDSNQVYKVILYACAKNLQQGYVSPADFNNVLMPTAQRSYTDYLLGEYQKYQPKRPIATVEFGQNERVRQSISPLIYNTLLYPFVYNGVSPFPSDLEYTDTMWTQYGYSKVKFVQQDRLDDYLGSSIDPIVDNPIYLINHEGFLFFPNDIGVAKMSYVRTPPPITWAYILDANNRPVYDPINSQQPVWGEVDMLNIIVRALRLVGVNLQLGVVSQYAEEIKNNGQ